MALGRHVEGLGLDRHEEPADGAHRHIENRRLCALQVLEEPRRLGEVNWMTAGAAHWAGHRQRRQSH
jgi:hypothetical protein